MGTGQSKDGDLGEPWNITTREAAEFLGLNITTMYRIPDEDLPFTYVGPGQGQRRYRASDLEAYAKGNMPIDQD